MLRLLHTADWQLGLELQFIPGDRGADARLARFRTVRRIAEIARARAVDAVLVAGDVFDDNAVGPDVIQRASDALAAFAPIAVYLLPGNHDAGGPDCALRRLPRQPHLHVLLERTPVELAGGARLFPCPLARRHEREDPTQHLPARGEEPGVRVALAHGSAVDFGDDEERGPNRIDVDAVIAKGFDYLALGDWHGARPMRPRAWYAGTPEPTRFQEQEPGYVLVVEIDRPGALPRVEKVAVAETRWLRWARTLEGEADVEALVAELEALEERSRTLLELDLRGSLSLAARGRLERAIEEQAQRLLLLRVHDDGLIDAPSDADFDGLPADGLVGMVLSRLRASTDPVDRAALRLLYRLTREEGAG